MAIEKVAMVTAGGSGMGAAAARRLAADGFKIAILSSSGKGETLAKELGGIGVTGPMQRYGTSAEATIAFLASDGAGYITGQNIRVDGGIMRSV